MSVAHVAPHVLLIGFMGAGKTTVGRIVADRLQMPFIDLDEHIEHRAGSPVVEIFAARGEDAFRRMETEALESLADFPAAVVAGGGGVVLRDENRRLLATLGTVVYLKVTAGEALARIGEVDGRPLLAAGGPAAAATLLDARESLYAAVADVTVDTDSKPPSRIAEEVAAGLASVRLHGEGRP
jgi:shikimate kinase